MRVAYRYAGHCPDGTPVYERGAVQFCCVDMARRWDRVIGFGARGCRRSTDRNVNLYADHPQARGSVLVLTPIECCPWCGEPVETCRVK